MTDKFKEILAIMMANNEHIDLKTDKHGYYYLILFDDTTIIWEIDDSPNINDVFLYDAWNNKFSFDSAEEYYTQASYVEQLYENP